MGRACLECGRVRLFFGSDAGDFSTTASPTLEMTKCSFGFNVISTEVRVRPERSGEIPRGSHPTTIRLYGFRPYLSTKPTVGRLAAILSFGFVGVPEDDFALGAGGGHIDNSLVARAAEHERDILLSFDKSSVHEHVDKVEDFLGDVGVVA
mgnify:CR=1 FL=1